MEIKRIDWGYLFCFLVIVIALSLFILYYYVYHVDACYANPLEYYHQKIDWEYGGAFKVYGNVNLVSYGIVHSISFGDLKINMTTTIEEVEQTENNNYTILIKNFSIKN